MSVEELVRRIRLNKEYIGGTNSAYRGVPELCDQIADKLEELAAEVERLRETLKYYAGSTHGDGGELARDTLYRNAGGTDVG